MPNVFGAMLSLRSPARMAFADDGRLTYTYGKPQGGRAYVTKPASWAAEVERPPAEAELCEVLRTMADTLSDKELRGTGWRFNYVLLQRYDGPQTFLSFHRDSAEKRGSAEAGQVHGSPVASVSLGASRVFAFTNDAYADRQRMFGLRLPHRCLVVMQQKCNDNYAHAILRGGTPEEEGVRYNLTFRVMQGASLSASGAAATPGGGRIIAAMPSAASGAAAGPEGLAGPGKWLLLRNGFGASGASRDGVKLVLLVSSPTGATSDDSVWVWFGWDTLIKFERGRSQEPLASLAQRLAPAGMGLDERAARAQWVEGQRVAEHLKPWRNLSEWK